MVDTILAITGIGFAPYSARGLTQTLEPIEQSKQSRRTINGELKDTAVTQFRKYRSRISCTDANTPAFDKEWPGKTLSIDCVCELSYLTSGGSPGRTVVTDSSRIDGTYTFYRPQLSMKITSWDISTDEYGAVTGWNMELEEV